MERVAGARPLPSPAVRARGLGAAALLLALALPGPAAAAGPIGGAPTLRTVLASADTSVRADTPGRRFGRRPILALVGAPAARAYLRFRLGGFGGRVVRHADLWVHLARGGRSAAFFASGTDGRRWRERTLTWRARPGLSAPTGTAQLALGQGWRRLDVTPLVRGNGTVDLALATGSRVPVALSSREDGRRFAPRLLITLARESAPRAPIRGAFYTGAYPSAWGVGTRYHPRAGEYDGGSPGVIAGQLATMAYGGLRAAIVPWGGPGTYSDRRDAKLLDVTDYTRSPVRWAFSPTAEELGDPSPAKVASLLTRLQATYGRDPAYLRVRGRPVVFVPTESADTCTAVERWVRANATARVHLVFGTVPYYEECGSTPDDWYHVDPGQHLTRTGRSAAVVSPGRFAPDARVARLDRDLVDFAGAVRRMRSSGARFQLVSSYDDWAAGTAVEPAEEWASYSGAGSYLDLLRTGGILPTGPSVSVDAAGDVGCGAAELAADGGSAGTCQAAATGALIQSRNPQAVLLLGNAVHGDGSLADYDRGYDPFWGSFKAITHPAPGNYDYCDFLCADPVAAFGAGYGSYWGAAAGPGRGYYSFDLGGWHVVSLNSECAAIGGCGTGSPEETWLRQDLGQHPAACTLAFWNRPRFTGGADGEEPATGVLWADLERAGAEVILNGHEHMYERFTPQSARRVYDPSGGLVEIVSGTGGRSLAPPVAVRRNTVVQNADTFGVTELQLGPDRFSWRFVAAPGLGSFSDSGSGHCH